MYEEGYEGNDKGVEEDEETDQIRAKSKNEKASFVKQTTSR